MLQTPFYYSMYVLVLRPKPNNLWKFRRVDRTKHQFMRTFILLGLMLTFPLLEYVVIK